MSDRTRLTIAVLVVAGAALQAWLWSQQVISGDQLALLEPGRAFAEDGTLAPFAKRMSGGGKIPGTLLPVLVGMPLAVFGDDRAPAVFMGLTQWIAVAILGVSLTRQLGAHFAAVFLAVYWLSPWRIFHSGFLWEPGYLLLPAALHFWCCARLRTEPRPGPSAGLGAVLVCTAQLHASVAVLVAATGWLLLRRQLRVHVAAAAFGAALGAVTLVPTGLAWIGGDLQRLAPARTSETSIPRLAAKNVFKTGAYWLRLGSPDIGRRLRDVADPAAARVEPVAVTAPGPVVRALVHALSVLALLGVGVASVASWRYLRDPIEDRGAGVRAYVSACLIGAMIASLLSPVTIQGWYLVVVLHAACIPVAVWISRALESPGLTRRGIAMAFLVVQVGVSITVALGHPMYAGSAAIRGE